MAYQIPEAGAVNEQLVRDIHQWWQDAAQSNRIDLSGFDPCASFEQRRAWALRQGLEIGTVYSRFSSKRQNSTADQVRTCVQHAATKGIYTPPELVSADEAQRGYRARRDGLERMRSILRQRVATTLLVFKASRLYRQAFKGYQLIQQEVVEEGLRAISVTQGIDTADTKAWKMLFQVHGMVDDMFVEATADHVRANLQGLHARGFTTGALPVAYRRKELPDAPVTNRGLARTVPEIDLETAEMIRLHYRLIRDGMSIRRGWKKWLADGGPADPRSTTGRMSYTAYRRMLSRIAYTGRFEFGRLRNEFSTKRDYTRQIEQPDSEVQVFQCEELRIVDDELFYAVQKKLSALKTGPRGPMTDKPVHLWDLLTDLFRCPHCKERFYQTGANGKAMRCKNDATCPRKSAVNRRDAVRAICAKLGELISQDAVLIEQTICRAGEISADGDDDLNREASALERRIATLTRKINDLTEMAGDGTDDDRRELMGKVKAAQAERASARHDLSQLQRSIDAATRVLTPDDVRAVLSDFTSLLEDAAEGKLGEEAVVRAVAVFRALVGDRVWVHVEPRPGRTQTNVRGVFRPRLIQAVLDGSGQIPPEVYPMSEEVSVWLREPPLRDRLAARVHQLIDNEGHSFRSAEDVLREEGFAGNSGVVYQIYARYYEITGKPVPKRPYNNGNGRRRRKSG